jgi:hypothetical protein
MKEIILPLVLLLLCATTAIHTQDSSKLKFITTAGLLMPLGGKILYS